MAATNFTPISLYYSTTASAVPTAANLVPGELAINTNDGKLYYEDSSGVVQVLATKSTGSIGGSTTQVQYNLSGSLAGSANMTFNGTTLTVNDLTDSSLTTGRVVYSTTGGNLTSSANLLYSGTDLTVYGLTVGRGGGAVSTNNAVGASALAANTSGSYNSAIGYQSSQSIQGGGGNVSFGGLALRLNVSGDSNSAFGVNALENNTGSNNTGIGRQALSSNNTASNNTAVGYQAGYSITGTNNTFGGAFAGANITTGTYNTGWGHGTINGSAGTGSYNTALGFEALNRNTTASNNTAVGYQAGYNLITSGENTAVGYQALYTNTASGDNVAVGRNALRLSTGAGNTVIGEGGGSAITTGAKNTILGRYTGNQGGLDIRTASNYIVLSDGDGNPRGIFDSSGNLLVGKTVNDTTTNGCNISAAGRGSFSSNGQAVGDFNRTGDDGTIINFLQDGTIEGTISVSGSTVSYNGGHLSRWSQWQNQSGQPNIYRGTVLESTNDMCEWSQTNEQSTKTIVSTTAKSKAVAGVFDMYDFDDKNNPNDFYVAQSGDFVIRIAQGVVVENGDLLESAGDGTARPQTDDICRSSTIAKVTSNYVSTTYADGSFCVPCILMIG